MTTKPLKIDWDLLEEAFSTQNEDLVYFLDLVTGYIHLEGEDSDDEETYDDEGGALRVSIAEPEEPRDDQLHCYIHPPRTRRKLVWLKEFLPTIESDHAEAAQKLTEAMPQEDPAPLIGEILKDYPEVRDAWYLYRSVRVQQMIEDWIVEHGVRAVDAPPWR